MQECIAIQGVPLGLGTWVAAGRDSHGGTSPGCVWVVQYIQAVVQAIGVAASTEQAKEPQHMQSGQ